jgi:predicted permease
MAWEQWFSHAILSGRSLFRRGEMNRDLNEEFQYHLDRKTDELVVAGIPPREARRAAQITMGGVEQAKEECRDAWGLRWVHELGRDARFGARLLRRSPVFTLSAIGMLGVAIGAIAVVFSLVETLLLRPWPFRASSDLVVVSQHFENQNLHEVPFSAAEVQDFRTETTTLEDAAAYRHTEFNVGRDEAAERVTGAAVTPNLFGLLGTAPLLGRTFAETDAGGAVPAVVISESIWRRRFAADSAIEGKQIQLSGRPYRVIGVMPAHFRFPLPRFNVRGPAPGTAEIWNVTKVSPAEMSARSARSFHVIARLRSDTGAAAVGDDLKRIGNDWTARFPHTYGGKGFFLASAPLREAVAGRIKPALWILATAVGAVLLIALFNLTAILLARGIGRKREFALRVALGAGRIRLARQLITEGLLLASFAAAAGLILAGIVLPGLRSLVTDAMPLLSDARINGSVLSCVVVTGIASGLCLGVIPALAIAFGSPAIALQDRQSNLTRVTRWHRVRDVFVIGEIGLGLVLLVCAVLLQQDLARLRKAALGFNPADVLTMELSVAPVRYPDGLAIVDFFATATERTKAIPGIRGAAFVSVLPISGVNQDRSFTLEGTPSSSGIRPDEEVRIVTPDYFRILAIPLRSGRTFTETDNSDALPVVIINEALAERYWPGANPLGWRIMLNSSPTPDRWMEVVGIVGNIKHKGIDQPELPEFYLPHAQLPVRLMTMVARTKEPPAHAVAAIRRELRTIDPELPLARIRTLDQVISHAIAPRRLAAVLVSIFAGIALVLGTIGMYSVMSFHFAERKVEIAMRLALGAERRHIVRLVLRRSLGLVALGGLIGSAVVLSAENSLLALVPGTHQLDTRTFVTSLAVFLGIGLVAAFVPALRAARAAPFCSGRLC